MFTNFRRAVGCSLTYIYLSAEYQSFMALPQLCDLMVGTQMEKGSSNACGSQYYFRELSCCLTSMVVYTIVINQCVLFKLLDMLYDPIVSQQSFKIWRLLSTTRERCWSGRAPTVQPPVPGVEVAGI
jgi:hypothetical protein